jgi:hypothetical protein
MVGTTYAIPLPFDVTDAQREPVPGLSVSFNLSSPIRHVRWRPDLPQGHGRLSGVGIATSFNASVMVGSFGVITDDGQTELSSNITNTAANSGHRDRLLLPGCP